MGFGSELHAMNRHAHAHEPHAHAHAPADFGRAFLLGIVLNAGFVVVEATYGLLSNSMALIADAGHNLSDVLGLVAAWLAVTLSRRPATARYSYGLRGSSILAALANAVLLLVAVGVIAWEAMWRLIEPAPVASGTVVAVAAVGIAVNGVTALMFARGRKADLNVRGAYLHMVADAAISAGVVVAGLLIGITGRNWIDPATSLLVVAIILRSTWGLLREAVGMSLASVPAGIDPDEVERHLLALPGVSRIHDLHVWPVSTTETALTVHLVMPGGCPGDAFLETAADGIVRDFGIAHATFQVETGAECAVEHVGSRF